MIKYVCNNCDNLVCETSICPVCNERTVLEKSEIYYCDNCNIPLFNKICSICNSNCRYIGTDVRPVFPEERLLLECIEGKPFKYKGKSIWNTSGNNYFVDGKKIKFSAKNIIETKNADSIRKLILENKAENKFYEEKYYENEYIKKFIEANHLRYNSIVTEAHDYINEQARNYSLDSMFISFSGGKDSTVTSDLVMAASGTQSVIHIYGDTTLEYPETALYLSEFRKFFPQTPMLIARNKDQNFNELCKIVGPPSRVMRWCCTIFKTGAINRKIETTFKGKTKILSFQGLRRSESFSRSKYDRESNGAKITKQKTIAPIIDWQDFDVWLYILTRNIPFNNAYKLGFSRVGCWCCPNNSNWSAFLSNIYMNDEYTKFNDVLLNFAKKIGKPDPEEYIKSGGWKARQGGNGLAYSKNAVISFKPCVLEENTLTFELNKEIDLMLYELFKPFGNIDFNIGNKRLGEVYVIDKKTLQPIMKLKGKIGQRILKVSVLKITPILKNQKYAEMFIRYQITKFQTCLACRACESVCKYNAISVKKRDLSGENNYDVEYSINEKKCVGCLECVKHFDGGCYLKKVLKTKNKE